MYVSRDISTPNALILAINPNMLPTQAPPILSKPRSESGPLPPAVTQKACHTPPNMKSAAIGLLELKSTLL